MELRMTWVREDSFGGDEIRCHLLEGDPWTDVNMLIDLGYSLKWSKFVDSTDIEM